jgi:hypothetical protein
MTVLGSIDSGDCIDKGSKHTLEIAVMMNRIDNSTL